MKRPSITIIGPGRVGSALARRLSDAGYRIDEIVGRGGSSMRKARQLANQLPAQAAGIDRAQLAANLVWFCVPDREISTAARALQGRNWRGKFAFHASGVLSSKALRPLADRGAAVASVHPLMTFIPGSTPELRGAMFAIEGSKPARDLAREIVRRLHGCAVELRSGKKPAHHAFAMMICPLLVSLLATAEDVAGKAGTSRRAARRGMMPIMGQTLENYGRVGPASAFTGPIARGDSDTIRKHMNALTGNPAAAGVYAALARAALQKLPARNADAIRLVLDQFIPERTRRSRERRGRGNRRAAPRS
jgi:predicted short-subunit dehydrogenase-like oxidoreductase (DUF2520 family)